MKDGTPGTRVKMKPFICTLCRNSSHDLCIDKARAKAGIDVPICQCRSEKC